MRRFSSYGLIDTEIHYYAPRHDLIDRAVMQLTGENPDRGGHYITVWAPRQTGKSGTLNQAFLKIREQGRFDVIDMDLEGVKTEENIGEILTYIEYKMSRKLNKRFTGADTQKKFEMLFEKGALDKPLILILDEFDALSEDAISAVVGAFRNIYTARRKQPDLTTGEKDYLLHGAALIGVRSVLGIENQKGSPFNVQQSLHIPNLTFGEVEAMFRWHERESGQSFDQEVIERLYYETGGQPGLTCWFGELLTKGCHLFEVERDRHVDMKFFDRVYNAAISALPNNNVLNIISKAKQEPYKALVLDMFQTDKKLSFEYDDEMHNYLYMNGVTDTEEADGTFYMKFPCPFVQKRLFNYFSRQLSGSVGKIYEPFESLDDEITETDLNVRNMMKRYAAYLMKNRERLLKNAPRRSDMRIYEAVFHFNLYMYLSSFMKEFYGEVYPEFPTGNGKIDLIIKHAGRTYGVELKSYTNLPKYRDALKKAAAYGRQLKLEEISLVFFVEYIDDENRTRYEADYVDSDTGVKVSPIFVETGA